jgi:hypothetical protein
VGVVVSEIKVFSSHHLSACFLIIAMIGLIFAAAPIVGATTTITLDSVSTKDNGGIGAVSTLSWSHTVASGASILIVAVSEASYSPPPTVVGVTFGSSSLTLIGREDDSPALKASHVELWSLLNPPAGTRTVTFTLSATETAIFGGALSFFNAIGTTSFTGSNDQSGTVTTPSITVPAVAGELVVGVLATCGVNCGSSAGAPAPGGVSTAAYISNDFKMGALYAAANYAPATSPVTLSWVYTSTDWAMGGVALIPPELVPEYPLGLPLLAIFMIVGYGLIKRRTRNQKNT